MWTQNKDRKWNKLHKKKKHEVPKIDGYIFISEEKEVETQTGVFLRIVAKGASTGPDLLGTINNGLPSSQGKWCTLQQK